ncbi:hypothetical protein SPSPH_045570 [Sporomusa sphaeroides DSM 2875]|uniref:Uncharacterized protein n=1 Tax=Sporomusa sphaeroides DSM 2875 TaxID=1337886 RepID=A0ABM9W069_9FIRM|nr:hypothetical protein SPSPH_27830 [Sporomusa sphaeroides DSM 2875]CVK18485.1 hypothetical protein SSPH_01123 [Sporomusa sphaeroides DSM 2875]
MSVIDYIECWYKSPGRGNYVTLGHERAVRGGPAVGAGVAGDYAGKWTAYNR